MRGPRPGLFGGFHPGYHEPVDTIDRLDFAEMERVVELTVNAARTLGGASVRARSAPGRP